MAAENPYEYYSNEEKLGSYVYVKLEDMITNFIGNFTGNGTILGNPSRSKIIYQFKQGIKEFSINALREVKAIELELGDTLDIILPHDYVNYVRISYIHPETGDLMVLSENNKTPQATSYLQDHTAEILFDDLGFVLEGTSYQALLKDALNHRKIFCPNDCLDYDYGLDYKIDPTVNINGTFNIDTRQGKIHFSSDNASRIIMLEYISDGLEYEDESDIKVSKLAEPALYHYVNYNLLFPMQGVDQYQKNDAKKSWTSSYRNAKIKMMNIKIPDVMLCLNNKRKYLR